MSADYVIWSGYQLKQEYFPQFMEALIGNIALNPGLNWGQALHHSVREWVTIHNSRCSCIRRRRVPLAEVY